MEKLRQADKVTLESFSRAMRAKLLKKQNEGRGGWDDPQQVSVEALKTMLAEHVEKGDMVDVANLAMMVWWREIAEADPKEPGLAHQSKGMGEFYSEAIDDNARLLDFQFGIPECYVEKPPPPLHRRKE